MADSQSTSLPIEGMKGPAAEIQTDTAELQLSGHESLHEGLTELPQPVQKVAVSKSQSSTHDLSIHTVESQDILVQTPTDAGTDAGTDEIETKEKTEEAEEEEGDLIPEDLDLSTDEDDFTTETMDLDTDRAGNISHHSGFTQPNIGLKGKQPEEIKSRRPNHKTLPPEILET